MVQATGHFIITAQSGCATTLVKIYIVHNIELNKPKANNSSYRNSTYVRYLPKASFKAEKCA